MKKKLLQRLLLTFILSLLLTGLFYSTWHHFKKIDYYEVPIPIMFIYSLADIFLNLVLTIFTLPVLFLTKPTNYKNLPTRILFYFSGPIILTLILVLYAGESQEDRILFLLPGLSFVAIHFCFYFRLTQLINNKRNNTIEQAAKPSLRNIHEKTYRKFVF